MVVLGAGSAGRNAVQMAVGLGARVTVLNRGVPRLRELDALYGNRIATRVEGFTVASAVYLPVTLH